jgi:hypothetical protein
MQKGSFLDTTVRLGQPLAYQEGIRAEVVLMASWSDDGGRRREVLVPGLACWHLGGAFRLASPSSNLAALRAHSATFICGHVHFDRPAASVIEGNSHFRALTVLNLLAAHIANHYCLSRHDSTPLLSLG